MRFTLWGTLFGFILSRVGATDAEAIQGMLQLRDPHLLLVIGGAVVLGAVLLRLAQGWRDRTGRPAPPPRRPITAAGIGGAALFGVGWAVTGACPGTALAQIGEGKLLALATVAGILAGTGLHALLEARGARRVRRPAPA